MMERALKARSRPGHAVGGERQIRSVEVEGEQPPQWSNTIGKKHGMPAPANRAIQHGVADLRVEQANHLSRKNWNVTGIGVLHGEE